MKKLLFSISGILLMALATHSESLTAPVAQGVYGGTVEDIEVYQTHADSVCLVISTRSPNSLFY